MFKDDDVVVVVVVVVVVDDDDDEKEEVEAGTYTGTVEGMIGENTIDGSETGANTAGWLDESEGCSIDMSERDKFD
jgi:hypothetical protein